MENEVGFRDGAYLIFDVQAYLAEHQKFIGEHKDLLYRVSILEDNLRTLKAYIVHARENISKPSDGKVGSVSKHIGDKCGKMDAVNDGVKVRRKSRRK